MTNLMPCHKNKGLVSMKPLREAKNKLSVCEVFGHTYDSRGICRDCGDDTLLKEMQAK